MTTILEDTFLPRIETLRERGFSVSLGADSGGYQLWFEDVHLRFLTPLQTDGVLEALLLASEPIEDDDWSE